MLTYAGGADGWQTGAAAAAAAAAAASTGPAGGASAYCLFKRFSAHVPHMALNRH
jgi:hypothetical protein